MKSKNGFTKKILIAFLSVIIISTASVSSAQATGLEGVLAGSVMSAALQAAGINFINSLQSLPGYTSGASGFASYLNDLFNQWAVETSQPFTDFVNMLQQLFPTSTPIAILGNMLGENNIRLTQPTLLDELRNFAAWVKTEFFGANADNDGGTVQEPIINNVSVSKGFKLPANPDFGLLSVLVRNSTGNFIESDSSVNFNENTLYYYDMYLAVKDVTNGQEVALDSKFNFTFGNNSYYRFSVLRQSLNNSYLAGSIRCYLVRPGYNDYLVGSATLGYNMAGGVYPKIAYIPYVKMYWDADNSSSSTNRASLCYGAFGIENSNSYDDYTIVLFNSFPMASSTIPSIKLSDSVSDIIQAQNTNNNQLPATLDDGDEINIDYSNFLTSMQALTQGLADTNVTLNNYQYEIGSLKQELSAQTATIANQTETIGDILAAIDALSVPFASTYTDAITQREQQAGQGEIVINGTAYTLAQLLDAIRGSDVTVSDTSGVEHIIPASDAISGILDSAIPEEGVATGILSVPQVPDNTASGVASSVAVTVGEIATPTTAPTTVPTTAPTVIPTTAPEDVGIIESIQALPDAIASAVYNMFAPDTELLNLIHETISGKFGWLSGLYNLIQVATELEDYEPIIYLYPHNNTGGSLKLAPDDVERIKVLDMTWYKPMRDDVNNLLSGIFWAFFLWNLFTRAADIISGVGMSQGTVAGFEEVFTSEGSNLHEKYANYQKKNQANAKSNYYRAYYSGYFAGDANRGKQRAKGVSVRWSPPRRKR